jgi:hypothetical protein
MRFCRAVALLCAVMLVLSPATAIAQAPAQTGPGVVSYAWTSEAVDVAVAGSALAVDGAGAVRISYTPSAFVKLAKQASGAWWTTVTPGPVAIGATTSLAIDALGANHIAYISYNMFSQSLHYVTDQNALGWQTPVVLDGSGLPSANSAAIAVDASNRPHAYYDGAHWVNQQISGERCWYATALAFDSHGDLHVAFYSNPVGASNTLRYGTLHGGLWTVEDVDTIPGSGRHVSLVIGSDDTPHIVYSQQRAPLNNSLAIKYAHKTGGNWQIELAGGARTSSAGGGVSLALDSSNHPYFAFVSMFPVGIGFAWQEGGAWRTAIAEHGGVSYSLLAQSLNIDSAGAPRMAFVVDQQLKYMTGTKVTLAAQAFLPAVSK